MALWWHSGVRDELLRKTTDEREREFLKDQYARRSFTTTLLGVIGLALMATELSRQLWLDAALLSSTLIMVLWILARAWHDVVLTRRHFRSADQGVRKAKQALVEELRDIEQKLKKRRDEKAGSNQSDEKPH